MKIKFDQLFVYRPDQRKSKLGTFRVLNHRYQELSGVPQHRFAKTYTINGQERTLMFLTKGISIGRADGFLDNSVERIKESEDLLAIFNKADATPLPLDLYYG